MNTNEIIFLFYERRNCMEKKTIFTSLDLVRSGQKLHSVMFTNGYSVKEVQEILNLSCPQSIYRWIRGTTLPSVDNLYMLSKLFNVHMEELLVEKNTENKTE